MDRKNRQTNKIKIFLHALIEKGLQVGSRNKMILGFLLAFLMCWSMARGDSDSPKYHVLKNATPPMGGAKWPIALVNKVAPIDAPGENGTAFPISKEQLSGADLEEFEAGEKMTCFNLFASDRISLRRSLPDNRLPECKAHSYPITKMPTASVVICFHNEAMSTLLRTVYSIVDRSPKVLLHEILLVDDGSNLDFLGNPLEDYIEAEFGELVKVVRTGDRVGLIKARLVGANAASGDVLIFLDSHCEAKEGWIEPLLYLIYKDRATVAAPHVEVIDDKTMEYKFAPNDIQLGGFTWTLVFTWHQPTPQELEGRKSDAEPIRTPTISGGLFAMSREYFFEIGSYDSGMDIWGAENLELSFRTWMCHGHVYIHPCSKVGHIFRSTSPYQWRPGKDVLTLNNLRLAHVWLDDYKYYYLNSIGALMKLDYGDISERVELRRRLKCNSFQWYIDNIFPTIFLPSSATSYKQIRSASLDTCLESDTVAILSDVKVGPCGDKMMWYYTSAGEIRNSELCMDVGYKPLKIIKCHSLGGNQYFAIHENGTISCGPTQNKFLAVSPNKVNVVCIEYFYSQRFFWKFKRPGE